MLTAIVTVLLTFLFTGIVANRLTQGWQYRNWVFQQRLIGAQENFKAIQGVFDEVSGIAGRRHNRMRLLLSSLRDNDIEKVKQRLVDYEGTLIEWNERLNALSAKLTLHLRWGFTSRLQNQIQPAFVSLGQLLERLVKLKISGGELDLSDLMIAQQRIDNLQGALFAFNRDVLRYLFDEKAKLYEQEVLSSDNLDSFPTWELFKALFKRRIYR